MFGCLKHQWDVNKKLSARLDTTERLAKLIAELKQDPRAANLKTTLGLASPCGRLSAAVATTPSADGAAGASRTSLNAALSRQAAWPAAPLGGLGANGARTSILPSAGNAAGGAARPPLSEAHRARPPLLARAYCAMALWQQTLAGNALTEDKVAEVNSYYQAATALAADGWAKAWHRFGIFNTTALQQSLARAGRGGSAAGAHHTAGADLPLVVNALQGFFNSVALCSSGERHKPLQVRARWKLRAGCRRL
jgi:FAT domain